MKQTIINPGQCPLPEAPIRKTRTTPMIGNDRGFAIVYGLVILLLVTVGGTALLFVAQKDRVNAGDYSKTRSTAQAANAAIKACEGRFINQPDIALAILRKYKLDPTYKYILNASDATANVKTKYPMNGAGSSEYIAEIKNFDQNQRIVLIEGTGYNGNFGKKKVIALYKLDGLQMFSVPGPVNVLYVSEGFGNLDIPITINGNVYAGGSNMFNGNSTLGVTVNGNFKTGTGNFESNQKLTINGKAFFRGNAKFQNYSSSISGKAGFNGSLELIGSISMSITNDVFLNGGNNAAAGMVNVSGGAYKAKYHDFPTAKINATSPATTESSGGSMTATMGTLLDMPDVNDAAPTIISNLEGFITSSGGTIYTPSSAGLNFDTDGWGLNTAYSTKSKWNDFLVVKISTSPNINQSGGTFTGKVIWIIEAGISSNKWYASGLTSNSLLYMKGNAYFNNFAEVLPGTLIRGVIYNASTTTSQTTYKIKAGTTIEGALIHNATAKPQFNFTSSTTPCILTYSDAVIQEFVGLGIMVLPSSSIPPVLTLVDMKIRPKLLTKQL